MHNRPKMAIEFVENEHLVQILAAKWLYAIYVAIFMIISRPWIAKCNRYLHERQKGYASIPSFPQKDPFLGLDIAFSMASALKNHGYLKWLAHLHETAKARTFTMNFLGTRTIHTTESENLKAMLSTSASD